MNPSGVTPAQLKRFGNRVRLLRKRRGWTQPELAERSGVSIKRIVELEKGRPPVPNAETLEKLATGLKVREGTIFDSLYDDTELVLAGEPAEPTYTEEEVTRRSRLLDALKRLGVEEVIIHKQTGGEGFVLSQGAIDEIIDRLNSLPDPESGD
jgi:transcriptional regulator with XRE-family HTH domain